jgi:argininosuccinate synthase
MTKPLERIVLAFSGSLASTVAIPWLAERHGAEVVAVTIDLGQGRELEEVRDRALAAGAVRAHVLDARDEFARGYIVRALKADATAPDGVPPGDALGAPLIAQLVVQIAGIEHATAMAHAANGTAMDAAARLLHPTLRVLAPARDWLMTEPQQVAYIRARQIPFQPEPPPGPVTSVPAGSVRAQSLPAGTEVTSRDGGGGSLEPAAVDVAFERGWPTGINGVAMPILDLFDSLGTIAAAHGVGRSKGRDLREAPAAIVLHAAHRALRTSVASEDLNRLCSVIGREYTDLIGRGLWFTSAREALDAFFDSVNERVTGVVRLKLFKGECEILDATEMPPAPKLVTIATNV